MGVGLWSHQHRMSLLPLLLLFPGSSHLSLPALDVWCFAELWRLKRDARACQLTSLPGMVSACCYQWVVTPSFRLPPLLCLCLVAPVSASGWRPGESHPRVLCIKAWWMCLSGWGFRPARAERCCPPPDRHPEAWPHYTVLAFQHGFQSVSALTSFPPSPFCVAASELRNI